MAQVNIIRHNPITIFSNPTEVIVKDDHNNVFRLIEPSGNVGTQYPNDVGSEWFGTIENLNKNLLTCGVTWSDIYKTDVLWTTPSSNRDDCEKRKAHNKNGNDKQPSFIKSVSCDIFVISGLKKHTFPWS